MGPYGGPAAPGGMLVSTSHRRHHVACCLHVFAGVLFLLCAVEGLFRGGCLGVGNNCPNICPSGLNKVVVLLPGWDLL